MSKQIGEIICDPVQVETIRGLLTRERIYVISETTLTEEDYKGKIRLGFSFYKHQIPKISKLMGKLRTEENG